MDKTFIIFALIGVIILRECTYQTRRANLIAEHHTETALTYHNGCFDIYAPEVGSKKATAVCDAETEQYMYNKSIGLI